MKYLGIDYGESYIGLAISEGFLVDPYQKLKTQSAPPAGGRRTKVKNITQKLKIIKDIILKEKIEKIVLGLPERKIEVKVKQFGEILKKTTGLSIEYYDETLTSREAIEKMIESGRGKKYRKLNEHNIAAAVILQNYLDNLKGPKS